MWRKKASHCLKNTETRIADRVSHDLIYMKAYMKAVTFENMTPIAKKKIEKKQPLINQRQQGTVIFFFFFCVFFFFFFFLVIPDVSELIQIRRNSWIPEFLNSGILEFRDSWIPGIPDTTTRTRSTTPGLVWVRGRSTLVVLSTSILLVVYQYFIFYHSILSYILAILLYCADFSYIFMYSFICNGINFNLP